MRAKIFDTFCVLVEAHGRLVDKDELIQRVWPDAAVEEGNLSRSGSLKAGFVPRSGFAPRDFAYLGDKAVSSAWNGFDILLPSGRFAEGFAQSRDVVDGLRHTGARVGG